MGCDFGWLGVAPDPEARRQSIETLARLAEVVGWSYERFEGSTPGPFVLRTDLDDAESGARVTPLEGRRRLPRPADEDGFTRALTTALNRAKRSGRHGYPTYHRVEALAMEGLLIYPLGRADSDGLPRRSVPWLFLGAGSGWLPVGTILSIVDPRCPEEQNYSGDPDLVAACEDARSQGEHMRGVKTGFMERAFAPPAFLDVVLHLKLRYVAAVKVFDDNGDCDRILRDPDAATKLREMPFGDLVSLARRCT